MASALRTVAHDDRLSLVEHLTELRVRIVVCLVAFVAATVFCMVENQRLLDILNKPLTTTVKPGRNDPLTNGTHFDQRVAIYLRQSAAVSRHTAASVEDPLLKRDLLALAAEGDKVAASAPKITARKPVTLGVS